MRKEIRNQMKEPGFSIVSNPDPAKFAPHFQKPSRLAKLRIRSFMDRVIHEIPKPGYPMAVVAWSDALGRRSLHINMCPFTFEDIKKSGGTLIGALVCHSATEATTIAVHKDQPISLEILENIKETVLKSFPKDFDETEPSPSDAE